MNDPEDVLERNLRRLFTRAYEPVVPTAAFRDRLAQRLERGRPLRRVQEAPVHSPVVEPRGIAWRIVAAAALLLLFAGGFLAYRALLGGEHSAHAITARGEVAILYAQGRLWRAIDPGRRERGLDVEADSFNVHTPSNAGLIVRFGASGSIDIAPSSHVAVFKDAGRPPQVFLGSGSVRLDNTAGHPGWGVDSTVASVWVERGTVEARMAECQAEDKREECLFVTLVRGVAHVRRDGSRHELELGVETGFSTTRVVSAVVVDEPTHRAATRTTVQPADALVAGDSNPAPPRDGFATLTGTLRTEPGAPPLGRYHVTILRKERLPAVATPKRYDFDAAERFSIYPVKPGTYDVYVECAGRAPWIARSLEIASDARHDLAVNLLEGTELAGRVVSARDGTPIANALVIVEDLVPAQVILFDADESAWTAAARTNAAGAFTIEHVTPGPHVVRASAPGFAAEWTDLASQTADVDVELRLGQPGSIAGRVAKEDGSPWSGAIVIASFMRKEGELTRFSYGAGVAEEDGTYSIADLPPGDYVILNVLDVSAGRQTLAAKQARVDSNRVTTVNLPDRIDGPRFSGRVLDAQGTPVGELDITLQPVGVTDSSSWRSQRVAADGRFAFVGLPPGAYDIFLGENLGEHFAAADQVEIPPGGLEQHEIRLGMGAIHGRVSSQSTSVASAFVLIERLERDQFVFAGRGRTDAGGAFAFEHLQPATYRATVVPTQRGFAPSQSADLWVAANGSPVECAFVIERGATLSIRVRDRDGAPAAGVALTFVDGARRAQRFSADDRADESGRYAIDNIAAGSWRISARDGAGRTNTIQVELSVGDEREVVLTLP